MNGNHEVTYAVDFRACGHGRQPARTPGSQPPDAVSAGCSIPRIARLMALAIRFDGLLRKETIRDYAELARLGRVTRARMTQIMKLLDLAPDIQEQILFLPPVAVHKESSGRLIFRSAEALLKIFMFNGIIDELKFQIIVGDLITKSKTASLNGQVRVFGEVVNLLWMPNPRATERLEELWNGLIKIHSVPLLCAYSLGRNRPKTITPSLLACHSHLVV